MEPSLLRFTHNRINYRISDHIWRDHHDRRGLITVDQIRETIIQPDAQEQERDIITRYWKWFPELGSGGNYVKVVVNSSLATHFISTAHPDSGMRKRMERR